MRSGNEESRNRSRDDRGRNAARGEDEWSSEERNQRDRSSSFDRGADDRGRRGGYEGAGYEDESPRSRQRDMGAAGGNTDDWRGQGSRGNWQGGDGQGMSDGGAHNDWRSNDRGQGERGWSAYRQGGQQFGSQSDEDRGARFTGDYGPSRGYGSESGGRDYSQVQRGDADDMSWGSRGGTRGAGGMSGDRDYGRGMSGRQSQEMQGRPSQDSMRGKGPKGWQRTDDTIKNELCEHLARHEEIDPSEVDIQVQGGEVTLTGSVRDRDQKRMIEDAAERIFGVSEVQNQLRVSNGKGRGQHGNAGAEESEGSGKEKGTKATKTAGGAS